MVTAPARTRIEAMWVVHLTLTLAALYAVIITGMYFAQTWLLFPTVLAGAARLQLPASTQRLEVGTPNHESLAGVRIPSQRERAEGAPTLPSFGGTPGTPRLRPSPCTHCFLIAMSSRFTTVVMRRALRFMSFGPGYRFAYGRAHIRECRSNPRYPVRANRPGAT
jgi:hypothetical protein